MFEYFDDNYTWNMAVNLALGMGASIGDIDDASRSLRSLSKNRDDAAAEKFFECWTALGDKLKHQAAADEARGRLLSAGAKYRRAFIALIQAERMQRPDFAPRKRAYNEALECFSRFLSLTRQNCRRVEVPYFNASLPALLVTPRNMSDGTPCMVHFDGLDVTKEIIYLVGAPRRSPPRAAPRRATPKIASRQRAAVLSRRPPCTAEIGLAGARRRR
jgi:tetratricopeptide (TPR) repeat protein